MVSINPLKQMKTMKKYIFMAVAGMLALSSCSNDDNDVQTTQNAPRQMTFTAGFGDGATTRATLSGTSVSFDAGDDISILSAKNTNTQFTTSAGGASATFSGTATDDSKFYAVYPYTAGLTLSGDVISGIVIPTSHWQELSASILQRVHLPRHLEAQLLLWALVSMIKVSILKVIKQHI